MTDTVTERPAGRAAPSPITLPVILAAQFVIPMSIAGTAIALPEIAAEQGSHPTALQWVVNGFNLSFAVFTLIWGAVSDRIGYRTSFRIGVGLATAGSVISAVAPTLILLDLARVLAGIGAAAVITGATSILSNAYTGPARARAFAVFGTINGLGLALGPSISGAMIAALGWRGVFLAHAVVLVLALAGTFALPPIRFAGDRGPVLDLTLLRDRNFLAMCLVPVAGAIGFVTVLTYFPGALSGIAAMSPGASGALMLAMTLPVLVGPMLAARLVRRVAGITPMVIIHISLIALVLGDLGLLLLDSGGASVLVVLAMVLVGFGFGLPIGLVDGEALAAVSPERSGTAAGLLNCFRIGSEALFVGLYAWLLARIASGATDDQAVADQVAAGRPGHPDLYGQAFTGVVLALVALVLVTSAGIVLLHRFRGGARP